MTPGRPLRICFVTGELLGAHKNGGIGTATTHLALFLAGAGHQVSVVYTGAPWIDHTSPWIRRCAAAGIAITHFDARSGEVYPLWLRETCVIYDHLRGLEADVILFQDWEGPAFSSIVAKQAGLAFAATSLVVIAHGPTAWLLDANRALARDQRSLAHLHMEGVALARVDAILCPSRHMRDWLVASGQPLAPRVDAVPLYLWSDPEDAAPERQGRALDRVDRIAFFGRLETRKGVDLFVDAITSETLAERDFEVVFLGKPASHTPDGIRDIVARRRPALLDRLSFETDLDTDAAQAYLRDRQCLAVIPSLVDNAPCVISECLRRGIPFLSTRTGGIPELIAAEEIDRVLVAPRAGPLAARIGEILGRPFAPARPAYAEGDVAARWLGWFASFAPAELQVPARADARIAVVLTHYERPALLAQALESLAAQTRTDFDLVLVDDGSDSPAAVAGLRAAEGPVLALPSHCLPPAKRLSRRGPQRRHPGDRGRAHRLHGRRQPRLPRHDRAARCRHDAHRGRHRHVPDGDFPRRRRRARARRPLRRRALGISGRLGRTRPVDQRLRRCDRHLPARRLRAGRAFSRAARHRLRGLAPARPRRPGRAVHPVVARAALLVPPRALRHADVDGRVRQQPGHLGRLCGGAPRVAAAPRRLVGAQRPARLKPSEPARYPGSRALLCVLSVSL